MKKLLPTLLSIIILSCNGTNGESKIDSTGANNDPILYEHLKDSLKNKISDDLIQDYIDKSKGSPVVITSSKLAKQDYGAHQLNFTLKNNSDKPVDGVKFGYSLFNNFGDNVTDNDIADLGFSWAATQEIIKPHKSVTVTKTIYNSATKVKNTFVKEVHFTDESKWESK